MSEVRQEIEKRAKNAILQEAFFRKESALNVGLVLLLAVVFPTFWWVFIILGVLAEGFIAYRTLNNPEINAKAVAHVFERRFQPGAVKSEALRLKMDKALEYLQQIETAVFESKDGPIRDRLERTTLEMIDWVEGVYRLVARLDTYEQDDLIKQDLQSVPLAIRQLRKRLIEAGDSSVKAQIQEAIQDRENQYASLQKLENTMENASLLLERNLSDMGRVYSQVHLMSSLKEVSGKETQLQNEISEHVHQLDDLVEAMDEFHGDRRRYQHEALSV